MVTTPPERVSLKWAFAQLPETVVPRLRETEALQRARLPGVARGALIFNCGKDPLSDETVFLFLKVDDTKVNVEAFRRSALCINDCANVRCPLHRGSGIYRKPPASPLPYGIFTTVFALRDACLHSSILAVFDDKGDPRDGADVLDEVGPRVGEFFTVSVFPTELFVEMNRHIYT